MPNEASKVINSWLMLQCKLLAGTVRSVALLGEPDQGPYRPVASWPKAAGTTPGLSNAAASALHQRRIVVRGKESAPEAAKQQGDIVACPISKDGALLGAVAVEITSRSRAEQQAAAASLAANSVWLQLLMHQQPGGDDSQPVAVVDLVAACVEHSHFEAASKSAVTEFATKLGCERVSLGFVRHDHAEVRTMSGTANTHLKMHVTRAVGAAMDEAIGQDARIDFPKASTGSFHANRCHEELAKLCGGGAVCTIPISYEGTLVGAMTFEHEDENAFDQKTVALCETVVSLIGPILFDKSLRDRWFGAKLREALKIQLKKLREPGSLALKICAAGAVAVVAFLIFATGEYRVTADATLEGTVQRVIGSPVAGYITEASARAGDIVTEGQLLARLDDKDLELERVKWSSEKTQLQREHRQAMALHDSSRVSILKAQLDQATARLALTEEYLSRMRVTAPMDGVIIAGDLSQSLGTPVERGDPLFAIAPLDSYRVMLDVDERDVRQLSPGQSGRLALVGFPDEYLPFEVERITPIATPEDGRNFFAVEARLEKHPDRLRPGMEGVGKIDTGRHRLIWIWTHRLIDWFRLWTWTWTP